MKYYTSHLVKRYVEAYSYNQSIIMQLSLYNLGYYINAILWNLWFNILLWLLNKYKNLQKKDSRY